MFRDTHFKSKSFFVYKQVCVLFLKSPTRKLKHTITLTLPDRIDLCLHTRILVISIQIHGRVHTIKNHQN